MILFILCHLLHQTVCGGEPVGRCAPCSAGGAGAGGAGPGEEQGVEDGVRCPPGAAEWGGGEAPGGEGQRGTPAGGNAPPETTGRRPHEQPQRTQVQVPEHTTHLHIAALQRRSRYLNTPLLYVFIRAREAKLQKELLTAARSKVTVDR